MKNTPNVKRNALLDRIYEQSKAIAQKKAKEKNA